MALALANANSIVAGMYGGFSPSLFVDSVNGSDANDGSSPDQALASWSGVETATGGDLSGLGIGVARGSVLRPASGIVINDPLVKIVPYAVGGLPVITTATPVTSGWTLNVNEYERSLAYEPSNIWHHDGSFGSVTRLVKGTYGSLTAGQWGYDSGSSTLAVRLAGDADPTTVTVEIPASGLVTNLTFTTGADGTIVRNIRSFFASQNGIQFANAPDCAFIGGTSSHNSNDGIGTAGDTATGLLIDLATIEGNGDEGRSVAAGDGISFHNASAGVVCRSTVRDNDKAQIDNGQKTTVVTDRCFIHGVAPWMIFADAGTSGTATIQASVVISDSSVSNTGAVQSGIDGVFTTVHNNTIFNRSGGSRGIYLANNDGAHSIKNNIVTGFTYGIDYRQSTELDDDYNDLYDNSVADYFDNGTGNFSDHLNDIHADALFTDEANDDFTIDGASPCVGAGTDVGVPTDRAGNAYADPPSMGAYEAV